MVEDCWQCHPEEKVDLVKVQKNSQTQISRFRIAKQRFLSQISRMDVRKIFL